MTYTYDPAGNRLLREDSATGRTTYAYYDTNELYHTEDGQGFTYFDYDLDGNRSEKGRPL